MTSTYQVSHFQLADRMHCIEPQCRLGKKFTARTANL